MMFQYIVDVAEQRYFIISDVLHNPYDAVVKFLADIDRFPATGGSGCFFEEQAFVILFRFFLFLLLFLRNRILLKNG